MPCVRPRSRAWAQAVTRAGGVRGRPCLCLVRRRARGLPPAACVPVRGAGRHPARRQVSTGGNGGLGGCLWCLPQQASVLSSLARASLW